MFDRTPADSPSPNKISPRRLEEETPSHSSTVRTFGTASDSQTITTTRDEETAFGLQQPDTFDDIGDNFETKHDSSTETESFHPPNSVFPHTLVKKTSTDKVVEVETIRESTPGEDETMRDSMQNKYASTQTKTTRRLGTDSKTDNKRYSSAHEMDE